MSDAEVVHFFDILSIHIDPKPELHFSTTLDLLVAVVLSAQTTDRQVNKVTATLWQHCRTPEDYLRLGEEGLAKQIQSIGLYRNKAKSIIGLCRKLLDDFAGEIPSSREALMTLPGVGRKTANVVLNIAFGQPRLAVDTHVFRVANRCGLVHAGTPEKVEEALLRRVPSRHLLHAHHYLILHGRYTCKARLPACGTCPVQVVCRFPGKALS
jgi:endonuclease-3